MANPANSSSASPGALKSIHVRGAREHNLKDISVDIPRDSLVVLTGLSGSGKSSLAFDTIYAEGQRRYVESLSAYARQFLEMMQKPDVDLIEGLSPAISIEQKTTSRNPRSTVGTVTEIYDYMRLLWARVGIPYSPATGLPIKSQTVSQMVDAIAGFDNGTRIYLLAPIVRGRKGEYRKELMTMQARGYQRARIDGEMVEMDNLPTLDKKRKHNIDIVIDRLIIRHDDDELLTRLADSVETALKLSDGLVIALEADSDKEHLYSANFACPVSGFTIEEIEPRLFSFNNPFGACPDCDGLGKSSHFDRQLVIPNTTKTLRDGAVAPWASNTAKYYIQTLASLGRHYGFNLDTPFEDLAPEFQEAILFGSNGEAVVMDYDDGLRSYRTRKPFEGVIPNLQRRMRETDSAWIREELGKYQADHPCSSCGGKRLKPEALAVKIAESDIADVSTLSIGDAVAWFTSVNEKLSVQENEIASRILKEINERLSFLANVGLNYLSMGRSSGTLSGGESQRIRLASQIGSGLTGVLYVLDEPSIGLHQRDNDRLLQTLKRLRDLGNTVLVVEHDEEAILSADYVIDMGPGAGVHGGLVVAEGKPAQILGQDKSLTGQYLSGKKEIAIPASRRKFNKDRSIKVFGASGNNLQSVDAEFPVGLMTCVTGVSGSGKSTLVLETLWKTMARRLNNAREVPAPLDKIEGLHLLDKVVDIDQSPIGRTPRSNPATYTGAFTPIREWFASMPESKTRGYAPGRFSFNVKGGRCEACQGDGLIKIEMHFLPDVYVTCDTCKGKRYNRETLEITWRGKSIADVLDMTIEDGLEFFKAVPTVREKLETMRRVGLGYIRIGQQATTLSGGEAQRIKLSKELSRRATGRTVYILDEPTTGLHFEDIRKLLEVLQELVESGNTVIVIEHNLDVIKTADWIIDIGPEGGDGGGLIIAHGTPEDICANPSSITGEYLSMVMNRQVSRKAGAAE
ncbi:MAG TPA: excinuclease ABC subunit UvrA [Alphaproteobacteria bacterium]|jgi:excinuclease ABC subunit A|nr:excinuclease ABC subunit UvrA [Alphaproteobacteria bacterium]|tara:strand:- start:1812 stop:4718 length:2907 start_codon:yes stop_codon:yes gene_type:complete